MWAATCRNCGKRKLVFHVDEYPPAQRHIPCLRCHADDWVYNHNPTDEEAKAIMGGVELNTPTPYEVAGPACTSTDGGNHQGDTCPVHEAALD